MHKPTKATQRTVTVSARNGIPRSTIAQSLGISYDTLMKYYIKEISSGEAVATNVVANILWEKITKDGNMKAIMFWLSRRGGLSWKQNYVGEYQRSVAEELDYAEVESELNPTRKLLHMSKKQDMKKLKELF